MKLILHQCFNIRQDYLACYILFNSKAAPVFCFKNLPITYKALPQVFQSLEIRFIPIYLHTVIKEHTHSFRTRYEPRFHAIAHSQHHVATFKRVHIYQQSSPWWFALQVWTAIPIIATNFLFATCNNIGHLYGMIFRPLVHFVARSCSFVPYFHIEIVYRFYNAELKSFLKACGFFSPSCKRLEKNYWNIALATKLLF